MDRRLTNSQMSCAKTCLRKHQLTYVLGIRRDNDAAPLRMGSAFHLGLDLKSKGKTADESIIGAVAIYDAKAPGSMADDWYTDWLVEREIVARLLSGYFWRWSEMDAQMEVIASELSLGMPITDPDTGRESDRFEYAGKLDKIVRLPDGRMAVMEHKTTGSDLDAQSDYWKRLRIDSQISNYVLAAKHCGYAVETVLYDVVRKPTIRLKKTETVAEYGERLGADMAARPDHYFARREIPRLAMDLADAQSDTWATSELLAWCDGHGHWPRNTGACVGFGRCPMFDLCTNNFDPASPLPPGYMRVADAHQELIEQPEQ